MGQNSAGIKVIFLFFVLFYSLVQGEEYTFSTNDKCEDKLYDFIFVTDDTNLNSDAALAEDTLLGNKMKENGFSVIRKSFRDREFDWTQGKMIVLRSAWDRLRWEEEWNKFIVELRVNKTVLVPPLELYDEITSKVNYLTRLAQNDVNIPLTVFVEKGSELTLKECQEEEEWEAMVFKPNTGNLGRGAYKVTDENIDEMELVFRNMVNTRHVLVQEFQNTFTVESSEQKYPHEMSLVFFDKEYSHAIAKTPPVGDFRVQGGWNWNHTASEEEIEFGMEVLSAFEDDFPVLSTMRVDMFYDNDDELAVMEISARMPDCFFRTNSSAVDGLAKHLSELFWMNNNACSLD